MSLAKKINKKHLLAFALAFVMMFSTAAFNVQGVFALDEAGEAYTTIVEKNPLLDEDSDGLTPVFLVDEDGNLVLDEDGNPIVIEPKIPDYENDQKVPDLGDDLVGLMPEFKVDEDGNLVLDEDGNPIVIHPEIPYEEYDEEVEKPEDLADLAVGVAMLVMPFNQPLLNVRVDGTCAWSGRRLQLEPGMWTTFAFTIPADFWLTEVVLSVSVINRDHFFIVYTNFADAWNNEHIQLRDFTLTIRQDGSVQANPSSVRLFRDDQFYELRLGDWITTGFAVYDGDQRLGSYDINIYMEGGHDGELAYISAFWRNRPQGWFVPGPSISPRFHPATWSYTLTIPPNMQFTDLILSFTGRSQYTVLYMLIGYGEPVRVSAGELRLVASEAYLTWENDFDNADMVAVLPFGVTRIWVEAQAWHQDGFPLGARGYYVFINRQRSTPSSDDDSNEERPSRPETPPANEPIVIEVDLSIDDDGPAIVSAVVQGEIDERGEVSLSISSSMIDQILMELHNQAAIEGVTVENLVVAIEVEVDQADVQGINVHLDVLIFSSLAYAGASFRIVTESFTLELNHNAILEVLESQYGEEIVTISVRRVYVPNDLATETEEYLVPQYEIVIQQGDRIIILELGEATLIFVGYDYEEEYMYEYYEEQEAGE